MASESAPIREIPAVPTLNDFIGFARSRNFSRSDRFMVNFMAPNNLPKYFNTDFRDDNAVIRQGTVYNIPEIRNLTMLCEEAAFPGKILNTRSLRINALNEYRAESADFMGDTITFQFLVDSEWIPRKFMETWMRMCIGNSRRQPGAEPTREVGFYNDYIGSIEIFALVPTLGWFNADAISPTPSDSQIRRGDMTGSILENAIQRTKRLANDQLDKLKTQAGSYIDPKATDVLNDVKRILNKYRDGVDPYDNVIPEKAVWGMTMYECFPRAINVQQTSYSSHGFHRLNATFSFKYWQSHLIDVVAGPEADILRAAATPGRTGILDRIRL